MFFGANELGLFEYDHDGSRARALEGAIGIKVIRHSKCLLLGTFYSILQSLDSLMTKVIPALIRRCYLGS